MRREELPTESALGHGEVRQEVLVDQPERIARKRARQGRKQAQQPKDEGPEVRPLPIAGRLIRLKEIKQITGLSSSTIYNYIKEDRFPKAVRLGARMVAWRGADVLAWQASLQR